MSYRRVIAVLIMLVVFATSAVVPAPTPASASSDGPLRAVALGDSYTAGNGGGVYIDESGECHRSRNSYVEQYANKVRRSGQEVVVSNYGCHGRHNDHVVENINEAREDLAVADLVFLTVGGNDANFFAMAVACATAVHTDIACDIMINSKREQLDRLIAETADTVGMVSQLAPSARVVLIGYPYLVKKGCHSEGDLLRILQAAADSKTFVAIDSLQKQGYEVEYMSTVKTFADREVCSDTDSTQWINGTGDGVHFWEWWHPNKQGYAEIANELFKLGLHERPEPAPQPNAPAPSYQLPPASNGQPVFAGLPFACGAIVPFVSTYGEYGGHNHGYALDMPMPRGTGVFAPEPGKVSVVLDGSGYGKYIDLQGDSGKVHRFAHLAHPSVANGVRVTRGQKIGLVGDTGFATGPHLHYEQRIGYSQIPIDLGGPALKWSSPGSSHGFKTTSHALVSGNCKGSSQAVQAFDDIMTLSYNHFAWGRSNGRVRQGWGTAKQNVFVPSSVDSCDFDRDGFDEYIALDVSNSRIMIADPKGGPNGHFNWRQIGKTTSARKIVCGDWNNDGFDDVLMHNTKNVIYYGRSDGKNIVEWKVARLKAGSRPTYWDMCDINGDGKDDVISYHAGTKRYLAGYRASGVTMHRKEIFRASGTGGFTCGNFRPDRADEIVMWDPGRGGRYMMLEFNSKYQKIRSDALQPAGLSRPHKGEIAAGDVDGDGLDEFFVNERRPTTGDHSIMVGDFVSDGKFEWYPFRDGMQASFLAAGEFVR